MINWEAAAKSDLCPTTATAQLAVQPCHETSGLHFIILHALWTRSAKIWPPMNCIRFAFETGSGFVVVKVIVVIRRRMIVPYFEGVATKQLKEEDAYFCT